MDRVKRFFENLTKKFSRRSHFELNLKRDQDHVFSVTSNKKVPTLKQLKYISKFYSDTEILVTKIALFFILVSSIMLGYNLYSNYIQTQPKPGGSYIEAVIGAPTYINPLFAQTNDIDQDLSQLIFSSLMKLDEYGQLTGDLAESYEIDENQTTYTFKLKPDILWHDGVPFSASDIVFTVKSMQDQNFKSPLYITFRNVQITKIDDRTVSFTLPEPFAPFLSVMTFGILPEHLWEEIDPSYAILAELNLKPIGTGPFKFASFIKDKKGNIREYKLERFEKYYEDGPYIAKMALKFFGSVDEAQQALIDNNVDGIGFLPQHIGQTFEELKLEEGIKQYTFSLPQYTALFFNQGSNPVIADKSVRQALALATSKHQIIDTAFSGFAESVDAPILPGMIGYDPSLPKILFDPAQAEQILDEAGWNRIYPEELETDDESQKNVILGNTSLGIISKDSSYYTREKSITKDGKTENTTLEITLTTIQKEKNIKVAEIIRNLWQRVGVKVNLHVVELSKIQKEIIKPRAYEVLLFGQILGRDPDPYPFWHSSQSNDPGLNLALYGNKTTDKLLEDARKTTNNQDRKDKYAEFQKLLIDDIPAIFLYGLKFTYITPSKIKGIDTQRINHPSDRFSSVNDWYIKTKRSIVVSPTN